MTGRAETCPARTAAWAKTRQPGLARPACRAAARCARGQRPGARAALALGLGLLCLAWDGRVAFAFDRIAVVAPLGDRHAVLGRQVVRGARAALGLPPLEEDGTDPLEAARSASDDADVDGTDLAGTDAVGTDDEETEGAAPTDGTAASGVPVPEGMFDGSEGLDPDPRAGADAALVPVELVVIDDPCRGGENGAEDGAGVAQAVLEADVDAVVGLICWSTLEPALREKTLDGIPMISSGIRAGALTENRRREGWSVWRVAPRVEDEARAVARHILHEWQGEPYAILDDGTIYGRELAEAVGLILLQRGSEPVFTETYRPAVSRQFGLARRIEGAGASRVFIAGERRDAAIIARDAVAAGLDLGFLGGDAMRALDDEVALPPGFGAVVLEPALAAGYAETTRAAVETLLAAEALAIEKGFSLEDALNTGEFDTVIGPVRFDRLGDLRRNLFAYREWNGAIFEDPAGDEADASEEPGGADGQAPSGKVAPDADAGPSEEDPGEPDAAAAPSPRNGSPPSPRGADAPSSVASESPDPASSTTSFPAPPPSASPSASPPPGTASRPASPPSGPPSQAGPVPALPIPGEGG